MKEITFPLRLQSIEEIPSVLFSAMSDGVLVTDRNGRILDCNCAFHTRLGYEKDEVIGMSVASLDTPEFASEVSNNLSKIMDKGRATIETAHRRRDGSVMPVEIVAHLCLIDDSPVFFGIVRDISVRKQEEEQQIKQRNQLARAEAIAHIGSWELDLSENRLTWSDEIYRIFEIDPEQFAPSYENFLQRIHPDDREMVNRAFNDSLTNKSAYEVAHRLLFGDGRVKWVNERGHTTYSGEQPLLSVGTVQDITQQKLAEEALRDSQSRLKVLVETLPDLVWLKDPEGVYLGCNHRFEQFFGASQEAIIGKTDYDFVDKELADFFRKNDLAAITAGGPSRNEEEITFASDGHREQLEVIKTPMFNPEGEVTGVLGIARDITDRKRHESDIKELLNTYQAAINTPAMGFWAADSQGRLVEVNDAYIAMSGYSRDELLKLHITDLDFVETPEDTHARMKEIMEQGYSRFRSEHRRKDGTVWPVQIVTTFSDILGGRFFVFIEDITAIVKSESQQKLSNMVFNTISQAVVITDADNRIISVNPATEAVSGYTLEELKGKDPNIFSSGRHDKDFYKKLWSDLYSHHRWEGEIWDRRKDGTVYPKWLTINAICDDKGIPIQYVSVFSDITERKKSEETIWRQANYDELTGLANRTQFHSRLEQEIERHGRDKSSFALLYLDLDGFKDVNDTLGHAAGDELLIRVAQRLKGCTRKSDLIARLGGDEFTLILADIKQAEQVASVADAILAALAKPIQIHEHEIRIGASIGVAFYPDDGSSREELSKHADIAMYQAKESGKNNFQFFRPEMNAKASNRLALIRDLHQAVERQEFQVYYQPKLRLSDMSVVGMEALIRWPRADNTMTPPDEFIPCAEETGLIVSIGNRVLELACQKTQEWNQQYGCNLNVAVNLSARQFRNENLVRDVMSILRSTGLPPSQLELEITEGILMDDIEGAIEVMNQLRSNGISIAIDDFGTGYSSLNYLKSFPINTLKVDRTFVQNLTVGSADAAIVKSTINLAHMLDLEIVAEGIETTEQMEFLVNEQCGSGQGYYISRPLPADDFRSFLGSRKDSLA